MASRREKSFGPLGKLFVKEEDDDIRRDFSFFRGLFDKWHPCSSRCSEKRKKKEAEKEKERERGGVVYRALFEGLESKGFLMSRRDERKLWPDITISVSGGLVEREGRQVEE